MTHTKKPFFQLTAAELLIFVAMVGIHLGLMRKALYLNLNDADTIVAFGLMGIGWPAALTYLAVRVSTEREIQSRLARCMLIAAMNLIPLCFWMFVLLKTRRH